MLVLGGRKCRAEEKDDSEETNVRSILNANLFKGNEPDIENCFFSSNVLR